MSARERRKGCEGEREVVALLKAHGWTGARRNFGSGSQGGGDVIGGPEGVHVEVKRQERLALPAAMRQAASEAPEGFTPLVLSRRSGEGWMASLPAEDLLPLMRRAEL